MNVMSRVRDELSHMLRRLFWHRRTFRAYDMSPDVHGVVHVTEHERSKWVIQRRERPGVVRKIA
jgi:hypothetical protein